MLIQGIMGPAPEMRTTNDGDQHAQNTKTQQKKIILQLELIGCGYQHLIHVLKEDTHLYLWEGIPYKINIPI